MKKEAFKVKVGDFVEEKDGAFFLVTAVGPVGERKIRIDLENVNGYMSASKSFHIILNLHTLVRVFE